MAVGVLRASLVFVLVPHDGAGKRWAESVLPDPGGGAVPGKLGCQCWGLEMKSLLCQKEE